MKKKITIFVCDICKEEYRDQDDEEFSECDLCKKDVCSGCSMVVDDLGKDLIICESCLKEDDANKIIKKFFKQKGIKEQMIVVREQLKEHLIKYAMLRSLNKDKEEI